MGAPASSRQIDAIERASKTFRALEHKVRLGIICMLLDDGEMNVSTLVEKVGIRRETLSRHLRCLRESELVATRRDHKRIYYSVSASEVGRVNSIINNLFG